MQPYTLKALPFDQDFWPQVAHDILTAGVPPLVLLPNWSHVVTLRAALAAQMRAQQRAALRMPRMTTLADWVAGEAALLGTARPEAERHVELFQVLENAGWLKNALGTERAAALWGLARQLLGLSDELTTGLAADMGDVDAIPSPAALEGIEQRLLAVLKGSYQGRGWEACSAEANLVLQIWRAALSREDGAALRLRTLARLASAAAQPLLAVVEPGALEADAVLAGFISAYARRQPTLLVCADVARTLARIPALAAAWPECMGTPGVAPVPLHQRAQELAASASPLTHFMMVPAHSLEDEAVGVANRILQWLDEGFESIALVVLDRVAARRIRALLERAEVLVSDETGWRYSTTSVAGALMRWLELCEQCTTRTLLDWMKSPFSGGIPVNAATDNTINNGINNAANNAAHPHASKAAMVAAIEVALRRANVARGWQAMQDALVEPLPRPDDDDGGGEQPARRHILADAALWLQHLRGLAQPPKGRQTLAQHFGWLSATLAANGMGVALAADPVGKTLLEVLAELAASVSGADKAARFDFASWCDFIGDALENSSYRAANVDSPVVFCSLDGLALRQFDGVAIVGADADHLPARPTETLFLTPALRTELGLGDRALSLNRQTALLALAIAASRATLATWLAHGGGGEEVPPAALLERLAILHQLAFHTSLYGSVPWQRMNITDAQQRMPAPTAAALLPATLSASGYNMLISCPYRYHVRYLLGIAPLDAVSEEAEKRDYGELVHTILDRFHASLARAEAAGRNLGELLAAPSLITRLLAVSEDVFAPSIAASAVFLGQRERWLALVPAYIDWWLGWRAEGWRIAATEVARDVELELNEQTAPLTLRGRLDRIDHSGAGDNTVDVIIDYKTRTVDSLKKTVANLGEDIQLPFYRLLYPQVQQARALFLSVDRDVVKAVEPDEQLDNLAGLLRERIQRDFIRLHQGTPMPAHGAESVCQYCDSRGLCRKGQWQADVHH